MFFSAELSETEYSFLKLLYDFECSYGSKKEVDDEINRGVVPVHPYFHADKDLKLSKDNLRIIQQKFRKIFLMKIKFLQCHYFKKTHSLMKTIV